jgi:hypothetical protein
MSALALKSKQIHTLLNQTLTFISQEQTRSGNFISYSSKVTNADTVSIKYDTVFSTALILDLLMQLPQSALRDQIAQRCKNFLISQKSEHWTFNYWNRKAKEAQELPYPDDLDDTFCALAALSNFDKNLISGDVLAHVVEVLTTLENKPGGPYKTWLVAKDAKAVWRDVDLAVNANIGYFLSLHDIELPGLNEFIEKKIQKEDYHSPYYPTPYSIIYFLSRWYQGKSKQSIYNYILRQRQNDTHWSTSLDTALAIMSLINLGYDPEQLSQSIEWLFKQQKNGIWPKDPLYIGVKAVDSYKSDVKDTSTYYAGSEVMTSLFCLSAFVRVQNHQEVSKSDNGKRSSQEVSDQVVQRALIRFSKLPAEFQNLTDQILQRILRSDTQNLITQTPFIFGQSLMKTLVSKDLYIQLGLANLMGWIAYTIYDDFFDDEGDPKMLSVGNVCLRELTTIYQQIFVKNPEFLTYFHRIMDKIDSANTWEVTHCRFEPMKGLDPKDLSQIIEITYLADKSLGHALGPLAIMYLSKNKREMLYVEQFYKHFLIAKQLNDDAHDIWDDLQKGHLTFVGRLLMTDCVIQNLQNINLSKDKERLQSIFWNQTILTVCQLISDQLDAAKHEIHKCTSIIDSSFAEAMLDTYYKAVTKTLTERERSIQFLKTYKGQRAAP